MTKPQAKRKPRGYEYIQVAIEIGDFHHLAKQRDADGWELISTHAGHHEAFEVVTWRRERRRNAKP